MKFLRASFVCETTHGPALAPEAPSPIKPTKSAASPFMLEPRLVGLVVVSAGHGRPENACRRRPQWREGTNASGAPSIRRAMTTPFRSLQTRRWPSAANSPPDYRRLYGLAQTMLPSDYPLAGVDPEELDAPTEHPRPSASIA